MQNRNLYFTVQAKTSGCRCEIRINDVPIHESGEESVNVELPVNQYVLTGINTLSFFLSPVGEENFGEAAWCEATVYSRPSGAERDARVELGGMIFSGEAAQGATGLEPSPDFAGANPPTISQADETTFLARRLLRLDTPFPQWTWLTSEVIQNTPQTKAALLGVYRNFYEQLRTRNVEEMTRLTALKARELSVAYNLTDAQAHDQIEFRRHIADPDLFLQDFSEEGLELQVFGNKRLAQLVDEDGDSPIVFVEKDMSLAYYMNLVYCRTLSDGWVQIR